MSDLIERLKKLTSNLGKDHRTGMEFVRNGTSQDVVDALRESIIALSEAEQRDKDATKVPDGWCLVPKELTPEIIQHLQMNTEIGSHVCENMPGAYALIDQYHLALLGASARALQSEER